MKMSFKSIFLDRLRDRLYDHLRIGVMKGWEVRQIIEFTDVSISNNTVQIDEYLKNHKVTLDNVNESIEEIIVKIILPSIKIDYEA